MPTLDSQSILFTRRGPTTAASLASGDRVLAMLNGKPSFIELSDVVPHPGNHSTKGVWICTEVGDIRLPVNVHLVTSGGLTTAESILTSRSATDIGRMEGDWRPFEVLSSTAQAGDSWGALDDCWSDIQKSAKEATAQHSKERVVYRLGRCDENRRDAFAEWILGAESFEMEEGPAELGWDWMLPAESRSRKRRLPSSEEARGCLLALWRSTEQQDQYVVPIEDQEIRQLTFAVFRWLNAPFTTDFRPRYLPSEVRLTLVVRPPSHATVQTVLATQVPSSIELVSSVKACYLVVNGFLCAA